MVFLPSHIVLERRQTNPILPLECLAINSDIDPARPQLKLLDWILFLRHLDLLRRLPPHRYIPLRHHPRNDIPRLPRSQILKPHLDLLAREPATPIIIIIIQKRRRREPPNINLVDMRHPDVIQIMRIRQLPLRDQLGEHHPRQGLHVVVADPRRAQDRVPQTGLAHDRLHGRLAGEVLDEPRVRAWLLVPALAERRAPRSRKHDALYARFLAYLYCSSVERQ